MPHLLHTVCKIKQQITQIKLHPTLLISETVLL